MPQPPRTSSTTGRVLRRLRVPSSLSGRVKRAITHGTHRLNDSWLSIVQSALGAGLAFFIALHITHHNVPFFAPMAAVIVTGISGVGRMRRAIELMVGVVIGVGIGDLLIVQVGSGPIQIAAAVIITQAVARFMDKSPLVSNQAAIGAVLVATLLPPGDAGGFDRMIDAVIGGLVAILMMALIPASPLKAGRREIAKVLGIASDVLADVAAALRSNDARAIAEALDEVRGTQGYINSMIAAAKEGKASVEVSPFLWGDASRRVNTLLSTLEQVDNAVRTTRVLARRAQVLIEDGDTVSDEQLALIDELSDITLQLSELFDRGEKNVRFQQIPQVVRRLRRLGARMGLAVAEGRVLSAHMMLGQSRSLVVDLLQVCGLSRDSAQAVLKPTSDTPHVPPELWED
ncbi:aromatic acid exporter family protein [Corynebacterium sp. TAE3-ERU30]|uniref:FUSC family protein n=1 Tax=Corynebacterium sp. TAE3-ERU30 TaxID=2849496 RepID=UPI002103DCF5|nr:FUSC family protein [Corynebacterium sp. TAE3-ERU30]